MRIIRNRFFALAAAVAVVAGMIGGVSSTASGEPLVAVSDVAASLSAPTSASGPFAVTGTLSNTGTVPQLGDSTLKIGADEGSVTSAPAGCTITAGVAVCTASNLNNPVLSPLGIPSPDSYKSWTVTITPNSGVAQIKTTATAISAVAEVNVLPEDTNNTATAVTGLAYSVGAVTIDTTPDVVRNGDDTYLTATVNNPDAQQTITSVISLGGTRDAAVALPAGCGVSADLATVTCTNFYAYGQTREFNVAVKTPAAPATSITSSITATGDKGGSGSDSTTTGLDPTARAFVPIGKCLTAAFPTVKGGICAFSANNGDGIRATVTTADTSSSACGTAGPCAPVSIDILFDNVGPFASEDTENPQLLTVNYGDLRCNGIGNPACTDVLYKIASGAPAGTAAVKVPKCATFGQPDPDLSNVTEVCLQNLQKVSGEWVYTVAALKDLQLPILGGASK